MLGAHFLLSLSSQKKKIRAFYRTEEKRLEVIAFFKYHKKEKDLNYIEWLKGSYDQIDLLDQALALPLNRASLVRIKHFRASIKRKL